MDPQIIEERVMEAATKDASIRAGPNRDKSRLLSWLEGSYVPIIFLVASASFSGYWFGQRNWSILWPCLILFFLYLLLRRRINRFMLHHRNAIERLVARQRLDRHVETVEWFNTAVERIWMVAEPWVSIQVTEQLNIVLERICPSFLHSLELREFTLGSTAPAVLGATVYPTTDHKIVHLDAEICFIPNEVEEDPRYERDVPMWNSKVVLAARVGKGFVGVDVPVMLKEFSFYGKVRIQLELAPAPPFLSKMEISFLESPKIDFILKPLKSFDLMDMPGLSSWLMDTINGALRDSIVDPNMITIPFGRTSTDISSTKVLKVTLRQIRGFKFSSANSPSVDVQVSGLIKASSCRADPTTGEWNEVFYVLIHNLRSPFQLVVKQGDAAIGVVDFPLPDFENDNVSGKNIWKPIISVGGAKGKACGELNFGVERLVSEEEFDAESTKACESGILQFSLTQIKGLGDPEKDHKIASCYYEAYVHDICMEIDEKNPPNHLRIFRSKVKRNTASPSWDEKTETFLLGKSRLGITVLVRDKDDRLIVRWTSQLLELMGRSDWFQFENNASAQLFASFVFRPVKVGSEVAGIDQIHQSPLGLVVIRIIAAVGVKQSKSGHHIAVEINGRHIGKTRGSTALSTNTLIWNKLMKALVRDTSDLIHIELLEDHGNTSRGMIAVPLSELIDQPNKEIEKQETFKLPNGEEQESRLKFLVGFYPIETSLTEREGEVNENEEKEEEENATTLYQQPSYESNCGVLRMQKIVLSNVHPKTAQSMHLCRVYVGNDVPCIETVPGKILAEEALEWRRPGDAIITDPETAELRFIIKETDGMSETLISDVRIPFKEAQANNWYPIGEQSPGKLLFKAEYQPVKLILEPEQVESGLLKVRIVSAANLIAVDSGGTSDPYCLLHLNDVKVYKTNVVKKSLNPTFDEAIEIPIGQKNASILQIEIRDWNMVAASRTLGRAKIELQKLLPDKEEEFDLPLENVPSGSVRISLNFLPDRAEGGFAQNEAKGIDDRDLIHPLPPLPMEAILEEEALALNDTTSGVVEKAKETALGEEWMPPPVLTSSNASEMRPRKASVITAATAMAIRFTIHELTLENLPGLEYECKLKLRKGSQTLFKTRTIKGIEHVWNESFTLEVSVAEQLNDLTFQPTWSKLGGGEFTLDLQQLNIQGITGFEERKLILPLTGSPGVKGHLSLKYSLTNDTDNMIDTKQRRRFSFLNRS